MTSLVEQMCAQNNLYYLKNNKFSNNELSEECCEHAARNNSFEMIEFLRSQFPPCPWNKSACLAACAKNNLEMLLLLRKEEKYIKPCPWDESCCLEAVKNKNKEMLKFLREGNNPCPWDASCCKEACEANDLEMLLFLRKEMNPPCPIDFYSYIAAIDNNNRKILEFLKSENCEWYENCFDEAIHMNDLEMVGFFCSQIKDENDENFKIFSNDNHCREAVNNNNLEMLQFLRQHNPLFAWDRKKCLDICIYQCNKKIEEWIMSQDE